VDLSKLGAFFSNPISRHPRKPAEGRGLLTFPGGFLVHSGFPNPGFNAALRLYAAQWAEAPLPVVVHLMPDHPDEMAAMTRVLENTENIAAIELGLREDIHPADAAGLVQAGLGELPLIVCLPFGRAVDLGTPLAKSSIAAFSLGPPRGCLSGPDGKLARGRLYGPGLLPQALETVAILSASGMPVIGSGGIYTRTDVDAMHAAGAQAVALDAVLWRGTDLAANISGSPD
jgi:dihydroorotate dehydrogenase